MNGILPLEILGVLICWAVVARAIWQWGPGLRSRSVSCPEKRLGAKVLADQREGDFGCFRVADVRACSLLGNGPPACSKGCMARL